MFKTYRSIKSAEVKEEKVVYRPTPKAPAGWKPEKIEIAKDAIEKIISEIRTNEETIEKIDKDVEVKTVDLEKQVKELKEKIDKKEKELKEKGKYTELKAKIDSLVDSLFKLKEAKLEKNEASIRFKDRLFRIQKEIKAGTVPIEEKYSFLMSKIEELDKITGDKIKKSLYDYERTHKEADKIAKKITDIGVTENFEKALEQVPIESSIKTAGFISWIKGMFEVASNFISSLANNIKGLSNLYDEADDIASEIEAQFA